MLQGASTTIQEWLKQSWPQDKIDLRSVVVLTCGSSVAYLVLKWLGQKRIKKQIEEIRRERDHGFVQMEKSVQAFKHQNPRVATDDVLSLPLVELIKKLKEDALSPDTVLYAYMEKALKLTREVNCVRHFIPECELYLQQLKKQKQKGLLYGVPVSIKDHIGYKGHLSTCGFSHFLDVEEEDSVLVKVLKKQGANPFVLTNVPQSLFNYDCSNTVFGQTVNPLDHKRSPGGSSGGEGALIAGGGSILGFGTDVGGSIRLPSSFCGICGLKPTAGRLRPVFSNLATLRCADFNMLAGEFWELKSTHLKVAKVEKRCSKQSNSGVKEPFHFSILGTVGPMARDVDSLALCMKALLCDYMFQLDPTVPPMPFNEEVYASSTPLRIGYYDTDGYFLLPPCMRRAVHKTRKLLQDAGHTLVPFNPPSVDYVINELFLKSIFADRGSSLLSLFQKDIVDPSLKFQVKILKIPTLVKKGLAKIIKPWFPRLAEQLNALCGVRTVKDLWENNNELMVYCKKFIEHWRENKLDVVLCPVLGPAFILGYPSKLLGAISNTMLYNALNFPAGVVPVTTVTEADEEEMLQYRGQYGDPWDKTLKKAVEGAVGLPVAVQCVALPWQEELCLRFMKEVEMLSNKEQQKKVI